MPTALAPSFHRLSTFALVAAIGLSLVACGGGGDADADTGHAAPLAAPIKTVPAPAPSPNTLQVAITIPGFPHKIDVYRPVGATKVIVFLHAEGGRTGQLAYDLGFNTMMAAPTAKTVNWDWLAKNRVIAVFPQGQSKPGQLPTWNNYVFDSGQDDVAFLRALSSYVTAQYGVTQVSLAGHSSGGVMTARMWCEGTTSFHAFVSIAGPMVSPAYPMPGPTCTPVASAPYEMIVGSADTKLAKFTAGVMTPTPQQVAAGLTDTILTSEWTRDSDRARAICGETPALEGSTVATTGPTWNSCNSRVRYTVVNGADHPIASLEQFSGLRMADVVNGFAK